MKLPICRIDAQTNTLCRKCKALYREGKISDLDIEISKVLVNLTKQIKELNNISFYSAIELDEIVILVIGKNDKAVLQRDEVISKLKEITNKEIKFLTKTNDPRKLVESLIHPIPIINISVLYLPPFSEKEYKVEISSKYKNKLPISEEILVQTLYSILNTEVYIDYV